MVPVGYARTLTAKVDGWWLGAFNQGDPVITVTYSAQGLKSFSWEMHPDFKHNALRSRAYCELYDGGNRLGGGLLRTQTTAGHYEVDGEWTQALDAPCINTSDALTTLIDNAVAGAYTRGEITFQQGGVFTATPIGSPDPSTRLAQLYDAEAALQGYNWYVNDRSRALLRLEPTTPRWHVPHAVRGRPLSLIDDAWRTRFKGTYLNSGGSNARTMASSTPDTAAEAIWGVRTEIIDLSELGPMTGTVATAILNGLAVQMAPRMGFAEGLKLAYGDITTPGGKPATLAHVREWQGTRLLGVLDESRPGVVSGQIDITNGEVTYTDGSGWVQIKPKGYAPRTFKDALELAARRYGPRRPLATAA